MKKIYMILMCTLTVALLAGCVYNTYDTETANGTDATTLAASEVTDNDEETLRSETIKQTDGTYLIKIFGQAEEDSINICGKFDYTAHGFPNTLEGLKDSIINNNWSRKTLLFFADALKIEKNKEIRVADVTMLDRMSVVDQPLTIKGSHIYLLSGQIAVFFEYKDPALIYYDEITDSTLQSNDCAMLLYTKESFEETMIRIEEEKKQNINSTGFKDGIPTCTETRIYDDQTIETTWYELQWDNYKVLGIDRYSSKTLGVTYLLVSDDVNNVYYELTLRTYKEAPSIEWIKNFVEGKPTSSAVTQ